MKKRLAVTLAAVMLAGSLAGCAGGGETPAAPETKAEAQTEAAKTEAEKTERFHLKKIVFRSFRTRPVSRGIEKAAGFVRTRKRDEDDNRK